MEKHVYVFYHIYLNYSFIYCYFFQFWASIYEHIVSENNADLEKWSGRKCEAVCAWLSDQRQSSWCVLRQCGLKRNVTK